MKDLGRVTGSLIAFHNHVATGTPLAQLKSDFAEQAGTQKLRLTIHSDQTPKTVQARIAHWPTKDFRQ